MRSGGVGVLASALAVVPSAAIQGAAVRVDRLRARILAWTLPVPILNLIFRRRTLRLSTFFVLSLLINMALALTIPLWMLVFGVLIQGVPHLVASVDFIPRLTSADGRPAGPRLAVALGAAFLTVAFVRHWAEMRQLALLDSLPNGVDLAAMLLVACWLARRARAGALRVVVAGTVLGGLACASLAAPLIVLGCLVLAHHFVGFAYWIIRAPTPEDRRVAILSLALLTAATAAILLGAFDAIILWRSSAILGGDLNDLIVGISIAPEAGKAVWFGRVVSALALGQSLHYLVWLKAIPEQELPHQHPIGFAKAVGHLNNDVGRLTLCAAFYALAGLFAYAFYAGLPEARMLYLSGAAFHGYFEIAGLAFIRSGRVA